MIDLTNVDKTTGTPDFPTFCTMPYPPAYATGYQALRRELDRLLDAMMMGGVYGAGLQGWHGAGYQGWQGTAVQGLTPPGIQGAAGAPFQGWPVSTAPADVVDGQDAYRLWIDLPGVDQESMKLSIDGVYLHISAQRYATETGDDSYAVRNERPTGRIWRSIRLPFNVTKQDIQATLRNGVLELKITKPDAHNNVVEIPLRAA